MKKRNRNRAGTTLVETIVAMLLFSILMTMVLQILSPAAKMLVRIQKLQFAQGIVDNTIQQLQSLVREATGYVKLYTDGVHLADQPGADSGRALEFVNEYDYIVVLSTDGCPDTDLCRGELSLGSVAGADLGSGRLLTRYYSRETPEHYFFQKDTQPVARAGSNVFPDGYYMGNYLEVIFSYPPGQAADQPISYLEIEVNLYEDEARTRLAAGERAVVDLQYLVTRKDAVTAETKSLAP